MDLAQAVREKFPTKYAARAVVKDKISGEQTTVWLGWTEEGGGWHQWFATESWRKLFDTPKDAKVSAKSCVGPWYYSAANKKAEVVEVDTMPDDLKTAYESAVTPSSVPA